MHIITIPHLSLRKKTQRIEKLDKKTIKFLQKLGLTLENKDNPRGVGLAAPQVNKMWSAFVTLLNDDGGRKHPHLTTFINPIITKHSKNQTLGPDKEEPTLEGCLSMPGIYGPVPRWEWVEVEYQDIDNSSDSPKLIIYKNKFQDFPARVVQHELDHLEGILFTDYAVEYDLPVYIEKGKNLVEIEDRGFLESY